jgi:hypothetical protein
MVRRGGNTADDFICLFLSFQHAHTLRRQREPSCCVSKKESIGEEGFVTGIVRHLHRQ